MEAASLTMLLLGTVAEPPSTAESSEALRSAVTQSGIDAAIKIIVVILLVVLFQALRSRFQRRLARLRETRSKPWES